MREEFEVLLEEAATRQGTQAYPLQLLYHHSGRSLERPMSDFLQEVSSFATLDGRNDDISNDAGGVS